jgi:hypothetical protein
MSEIERYEVRREEVRSARSRQVILVVGREGRMDDKPQERNGLVSTISEDLLHSCLCSFPRPPLVFVSLHRGARTREH